MVSYRCNRGGRFAWLGLLLLLSGVSVAMERAAFLQQFVRNHEEQRFNEQLDLVRLNKPVIPGVVAELIETAMEEGQAFERRMQQLNIASAIAYMYLHWHGDDALVRQVTPFIERALKREQQRTAEIMKWKKEERFLGNFVMQQHREEMERENLPMVLYPHWLHRILYECKVCHERIFKMQRWEGSFSHRSMEQGALCGVCHNGVEAFAVEDRSSCTRCHIAGSPDAEHLHHPEKVRQSAIREMAERVGARWRPENLPDGRLPLDRFRFIDWMKLKENDVFAPVASLEADGAEEIRDNRILFASRSGFVDDVIFDHRIHSDWIQCASCHPAIFKEELGGNRMKMIDMSKGRYCGRCHGRVSFTFADCLRCHKKTTGKLSMDVSRVTDALRRPLPPDRN